MKRSRNQSEFGNFLDFAHKEIERRASIDSTNSDDNGGAESKRLRASSVDCDYGTLDYSKIVSGDSEEGYKFFSSLAQNGFCVVDVGFTPALYISDVGGSTNDLRRHVGYGPLVGLNAGPGWTSYFHRKGNPKSGEMPTFANPELKQQLDDNFSKLYEISSNLLGQLLGPKAREQYHKQYLESKRSEMRNIIMGVMQTGEQMAAGGPPSKEGLVHLLDLFEDSKHIKDQMKVFSQPEAEHSETSNSVELKDLLYDYKAGDGPLSPDFLQMLSYKNGSLAPFIDAGLLTLIFVCANLSGGAGLEVRGAGRRAYADVERRLLAAPRTACAVVAGYQLQALTERRIRAGQRRIAPARRVSTSFSLGARAGAALGGRSVAAVRQEWNALGWAELEAAAAARAALARRRAAAAAAAAAAGMGMPPPLPPPLAPVAPGKWAPLLAPGLPEPYKPPVCVSDPGAPPSWAAGCPQPTLTLAEEDREETTEEEVEEEEALRCQQHGLGPAGPLFLPPAAPSEAVDVGVRSY